MKDIGDRETGLNALLAIAQGLARELKSKNRKRSVICPIYAHDADTKGIGEMETGLNALRAIAQGLAGWSGS